MRAKRAPRHAQLDRCVPAHQPADGVKTERDATGTYPSTLSSENFIVKWGSSGGVTDGEVTALLDAFAAAWAMAAAKRRSRSTLAKDGRL